VRDFQRQKGLRVDRLLNPGGLTIGALGRVLARPPLKGLLGAVVSANARLVRDLMTTTADGIISDLMADDFRTNEAGRAKTADFLSQLFRRDPENRYGSPTTPMPIFRYSRAIAQYSGGTLSIISISRSAQSRT